MCITRQLSAQKDRTSELIADDSVSTYLMVE
jgi:hypothetical protein